MATESKDVELRVRARDYSQKDLKGVISALEDMTKAQAEQLAGAKKGEVSATALANSYNKIEDAVKALISQNALTKVFEDQAKALEDAKAKTDAARDAQTAYANSLAGVEEKTKKQITAQDRLAKAVAAADKSQLTAQTRLDKTVEKLGKYGIAVANIADAQKQMAAGVAVGNAALERQAAALDTVEADQRQAAAAATAAATAQKAAAAEEAAALKQVADAAAQAAAFQQKLTTLYAQRDKAAFESAKADAAMAAAMRASAQQAEANAKGYMTLARSVKSVRGDELANQLQEIVAPAATANDNLNGLTANVERLAKTVAAINGPVKDFRSTVAGLESIQKGSAGVAAQIDAYRRQIDVLRQARTEYSNARTAVAALTTQMRAGGGDAAELSKQLTAADATLKRAAGSISQQVSVTRELRAALKEAGVDTANLGAAEKQLVDNVNSATSSLGRLNAAYKANGAAAESAGKGTFKFFDNTRTTLSYTQRLRGELIAMATAYIGLNAAVELGKSSLEAYNTLAKTQSALIAANGGDVKAAADDYAYLRAAADRIGISFKETSLAFAKFSIAARSYGLTAQETRFTFEKFAEASTKAGLSGSEFEGVLKALEQMLSKGTIQAEELRGQLGDRLPGAFVKMAAAIGVTTAELGKLMEGNAVLADNVINLAREYDKSFKGVDDGTLNLIKAQARFSNAQTDFLKSIADSGFAEAFTNVLNRLTEFMNSADGAALAKSIGGAFTTISEAAIVLINNIDALKTGFQLLIDVAVALYIVKIINAAVKLYEIFKLVTIGATAVGAVLGTAGVAAGGAAAGVGALGLAFRFLLGPIGLAITAIQLAIIAYDQLTNAKKRSEGVATGKPITAAELKAQVDKIPGGPGKQGPTADPESGGTASKRAADAQAKEAEKRQAKLDKDRKSAMKKSAKDEIDERAGLIKEEYDLYRKQAKDKITDADALAKQLATIDAQQKQALTTDQIRYDAEHAKSGAAAANKEITLKEQVKNALLKIQDDLAAAEVKADKDASFEDRKKTRLDAISHSYDKLKKTITELSRLDKAGAADASKKLDAYIGQLQKVEEIKTTTDEVKRLEKELDDQQKLRQAGLDKEKLLYDAGISSQETFLKNTSEINQKGDDAVTVAANNLQNFVDAAVKAKAGIVSLTDQAEIKVKTTAAVAGSSNTGNKNADAANKLQEEAIDNLITKRSAAEAIYKAQFDLRMISEDEYAQKVNANADTYKSKILELNTALLAQLETQRAQGILEGTLNPTRLAALDAQIAKQQLLGTTVANAIPVADTLGRTLSQGLGQGLDTALNGLVDGLKNMAEGTTTLAGGFQAMAASALSAFATILQQIAIAIAKQLILNAIASAYPGGSVVGLAARAAGGIAGVNHRGGVVGAANGPTRPVNPAWFAGAPRFHEGGFPGLKSDEVASVLQTGEEVLARDDPRNVLNGASKTQQSKGNRFVFVDDRAKIPEAMRSAEGEQVTVINIRKNAATIKQILK